MRILVVSDSHGNAQALRRALDAQPDALTVIHLGDGLREAEEMERLYPERTFHMVWGNSDFAAGALYPETGELICRGKRICYTHGHRYQVKLGLTAAVLAARERRADLLLFGHTHRPLTDYERGLYLLNPGSVGKNGSYGIVDITNAGIVTAICSLS